MEPKRYGKYSSTLLVFYTIPIAGTLAIYGIAYLIFRPFFNILLVFSIPFIILCLIFYVLVTIVIVLTHFDIHDDRIVLWELVGKEIRFESIENVHLVVFDVPLFQIRRLFVSPLYVMKRWMDAVDATQEYAKEKNPVDYYKNISNIIYEYNRQTAIARLGTLRIGQIMIKTSQGYQRIAPGRINEFLYELAMRFESHMKKRLDVEIIRMYR
jgi:hypothetical protein